MLACAVAEARSTTAEIATDPVIRLARAVSFYVVLSLLAKNQRKVVYVTKAKFSSALAARRAPGIQPILRKLCNTQSPALCGSMRFVDLPWVGQDAVDLRH